MMEMFNFKENETWILIAFLVFLGALGRTGWRFAKGGLDQRGAKIAELLAEAAKLRAEAQILLADSRAKQEQAVRDAAEIIEAAKEEAEQIRKEGEANLERTLAVRSAQALERIALAEQAALQEVRGRAVDIAIRAATSLVAETLQGAQADTLVDQAIQDLPRRAA